MATYFISDLHLDPKRPASSRAFISLLNNIQSADALYILGDLLEYWIGDDDVEHGLDTVFECMHSLTEAGVPIYFMHGNRDFLIGKEFAHRYGLQLLSDPYVTDLYGNATLLMHGDLLCTDDSDYQNFRLMVRNPDWQSQFQSQSLEERRNIVLNLRKNSRQAMQGKSEDIMDVNPTTVEQLMQEYSVNRLIHGHTHRPAKHQFKIDAQEYERIVLGDWYTESSILRCDDGRFKFVSHKQAISPAVKM